MFFLYRQATIFTFLSSFPQECCSITLPIWDYGRSLRTHSADHACPSFPFVIFLFSRQRSLLLCAAGTYDRFLLSPLFTPKKKHTAVSVYSSLVLSRGPIPLSSLCYPISSHPPVPCQFLPRPNRGPARFVVSGWGCGGLDVGLFFFPIFFKYLLPASLEIFEPSFCVSGPVFCFPSTTLPASSGGVRLRIFGAHHRTSTSGSRVFCPFPPRTKSRTFASEARHVSSEFFAPCLTVGSSSHIVHVFFLFFVLHRASPAHLHRPRSLLAVVCKILPPQKTPFPWPR